MATDEKQSIGQLIENLKETIRLKWVELHEQLTSPEQRKVLQTEIKNAVDALGNTLKQFDLRRRQVKKKGATKKNASAKKKTSGKKSVRSKAGKKK